MQRYITDHPDLGEELAPDLNAIQAEDDQLKDIEERLKVLVSKREKGVKNIAKLNGVINQSSGGRVAPRRKRKRDESGMCLGSHRKFMVVLNAYKVLVEATLPNDTLSQAQNACQNLQMEVNSYANQLWSLQTKKESIESSLANNQARIKAKCIKNRNEIQIAAITEEFETGRKELGEQDASRPLQIFCVSAKAFLDLCSGQEGEALACGVFTKADTGIPTFRDALIAKTWETRLHNSRTFNEGVANAAALLDMWSADTIADFKMKSDERAVVETKLDEMYGALEQVCNFHSQFAISLSDFEPKGI